ncbi:hypothetical protein PPERSA_02020 [Pseudocohnilembus persalinus]|uniref:Uncharacterized protein n=1 Tax=Pseudocohnilembus persalinus TaxID=266149 RepID=A0A0V0QF59_PSEPJ|nr:hypothetical protein PPERSA_02020 [Pseudocohnilembus persalinus]|eukprot:KRX00841.1 hypothetical protein PPERSA_02020 [Pseudocohnilembus persalinus]
MEQENLNQLNLDAIKEFYNLKGNIEGIKQWHYKYTPDLTKSEQVFKNIMSSYEQEYTQIERVYQLKENQQKRLIDIFGESAVKDLQNLPELSNNKGCDCYFVKIKSMSEKDMLINKSGKCFCGQKNKGILDPIAVE